MILLRRRKSEAGPAVDPGNWQAPPELLGSAPRPVKLSGAGKALAIVAVLFAAAALSSGVLLYTSATHDLERNRRFEREAVAAEARVLGVRWTRGESPVRIVRYEYAVGGRVFHGELKLPKRDTRVVAAGSTIDVRYPRSQPEVSWAPGHLGGTPLWLVAAVPVPLAFFSWLLGWRIRGERRLLSAGRVAMGRITRTSRVATGQHRQYRVEYEFQTLSGGMRKGRHNTTRTPFPVGSALTIVYDPDEPARNSPYPFKLARVAR